MADPKPIGSLDELRDVLMEGKSTYRILMVAGKPHKLQAQRLLGIAISIGEARVIADHKCGMATAGNSKPVEAVALDPHRAPATRGEVQAGNRLPHALVGAQTGVQGFSSEILSPLGPVTRAILPRSSYVNRVCDECNEMIGEDWNIVGVQLGDRWMWVRHVECN